MILVDTSVLVAFLAGRPGRATAAMDQLLAEGATFFLAPVVIQEVLQGARDEREWKLLARHLNGLSVVHAANPLDTARGAARISFDCRRRGLTVRSSVDCWIAQLALEHDLVLLHDDRDFDVIAKVRKLRVAQV